MALDGTPCIDGLTTHTTLVCCDELFCLCLTNDADMLLITFILIPSDCQIFHV